MQMIETNQCQQCNIQLLATNNWGWRNDYVVQIDLEVGGRCSCFHANIKFSFLV